MIYANTTQCPWTGCKRPNVKARQVIICGSRTFDDYGLLETKLDLYTYFFDMVEVHIGGYGHKFWDDEIMAWRRRGADHHANTWAERHWWIKHIHHADWDKHKKAAGPIRNREMAVAAGPNAFCIAFWDGESHGTKSMIHEFLKVGKENRLKVVEIV